MPDQFTTTTTTGLGGNIVKSIQGAIFGLIIFIAAFGVLYWNEGRVDLSSIARTAVEISSATVNADPSLSGKLVSTTGTVSTGELIGDGLFFNSGNYLAVGRTVEMYSWVESQSSSSHNNVGGSTTTTTTYSYSQKWTDNPASSSDFKEPQGHQNPQKTIGDSINKATSATVGVYNFDPSNAILPSLTAVQINSQNTTLSQNAILSGGYVFVPANTNDSLVQPGIGDLRVSYSILQPGFSGTIFGSLNGNSIGSYTDQNNNTIYRLFAGSRGAGIATFHSDYELWLWIFRVVGFLMMWFGLSMLFGPIIAVLDILPIFGEITGFLISIITFLVALILTIVTVVISMILHNLIALIVSLVIVVVIIVAFLIFLRERKKNSKPASSYVSNSPNNPAA